MTAVLFDSHTKYPVVEIISSTAFSKVKLVLEKIFAMLGLPDEIRQTVVRLFKDKNFVNVWRFLVYDTGR